MSRHPAFIGLSRDHQEALVVASALRRASPGRTGGPAHALVGFWESGCRDHLRIEEEVLLPIYAQHGSPAEPCIARMLVDHIALRRDIERVRLGASAPELRRCGEALAAHVRLEEHKVFPLIETTLSEAQLDHLAARLKEAGP